MTEAMNKESEEFSRVETLATEPMVLYFTSGTTGYPKGVIHDFTYPLAHIVTAKYWQQAEDNGLHFTVAETGWAKASWGKIYGQWLVGSAVMVYDFDNFDPRQLTNVIVKYGVTSFCAPPTVYRYLVRKGIPDMPTLRHAATAGEIDYGEVSQAVREYETKLDSLAMGSYLCLLASLVVFQVVFGLIANCLYRRYVERNIGVKDGGTSVGGVFLGIGVMRAVEILLAVLFLLLYPSLQQLIG